MSINSLHRQAGRLAQTGKDADQAAGGVGEISGAVGVQHRDTRTCGDIETLPCSCLPGHRRITQRCGHSPSTAF